MNDLDRAHLTGILGRLDSWIGGEHREARIHPRSASWLVPDREACRKALSNLLQRVEDLENEINLLVSKHYRID